MAKHHFHLQANWPGGRNEVGTIEAGQLKQAFLFHQKWTGQEPGQIQMKCC